MLKRFGVEKDLINVEILNGLYKLDFIFCIEDLFL